jgi:hypothetical protein
MSRFISRIRERGATRVEFLDVVTAIIVLAVLVWAASRQFPAYRSAEAPAPAASQTH